MYTKKEIYEYIKNGVPLTEDELKKVKDYIDYMKLAKVYDDYTDQPTKDNVNEYNREMNVLKNLNERSELQNNILKENENVHSLKEDEEIKEQKNEEILKRKLIKNEARKGYIDSVVLITSLIIFGLSIAKVLLG